MTALRLTANGELDANEEICLYVSSISTDITPTVLDDSPDVQSLGKRCIEDGFGFHWEPHSLTPYLVEPGTGRHIRFLVENFCPYLVDHIGAVPTLMHKNNVMATLTPTSSDPAKVRLGAAVEIPAAVNMAELRLDAVAELPPADPPPAPHVDVDPDGRRDLKAEAKSTAHILRHMPFNKYCETCVRAKMLRRPARRTVTKAENTPKKFGDLVNADHIIANSDEAMGLTGERNALAIVDRFSDYKDCFLLATKDAEDAYGALLEFFGRSRPKYMWTDSAPELIRAISDMKVPHCKATPSRHQNNGYCERVVRKIVEGARAILEHAGLPSCFWTFAVRYWCFLDNVTVTDGDSPWNLRHNKGQFAGPLIPFGCLVDYLPKPETVKQLPKFEPRGHQGIFVGYSSL